MKIDLFDARMLSPLVAFLEQNGARPESFLDRARIPGELIAEGGWIAKKQAYDFTFEITRRSQCPEAVHSAYLEFELCHLGPINTAMKSCKTVKEALEVAARLGSTAYEGNEYFLKIDGDTTWLCYREPKVISQGHRFIKDMTVTVYYRMIRALIEEDWRPERMLLWGEVNDRHLAIEDFEDCQADYHPDYTALGFPTKFLSRRLPGTPPTDKLDEREAWLFGPDESRPITEPLYRLIASRFPYRKLPTLDQVARMVGTSPATVKRLLRSEGMTYHRLLDRLRFDTACELLAIPQMTVREIAQELGYSGTSNFVRSFRRMTGTTPGKYQRQ